MKRILTAALFAAATATVSAQVYVGGTVGFESSKNKGATAVNNFIVMPEIGYKVDDKMKLGIELGYQHTGNMYSDLIDADDSYRIKGNSLKIAPYLRYTIIKVGDFRGFLDEKICFQTTGMKAVVNNGTTTTTEAFNDNLNSFAVTIEPGVEYDVTGDVTIVCKTTNLLGFYHSWCGDNKNNTFGIGASSMGITFGAYFHF